MVIPAQIVFLHIEKTAGTSQRALFDRNYGRDQVFWRGRDFQVLQNREFIDIDDQIVVGGHVSLEMFRKSAKRLLYAAVVREPVNRAVSLFHYFAENAPDEDRRVWKNRGLNPVSMLKTIDDVPEFRDALNERQCYRLSGKKSFQAVRSALEEHNFVVGYFDGLEDFNARLAELLNWPHASLGRDNTAHRVGYQEKILREPGLKERILELSPEDQKLYQFIAQQGCYEHLPDKGIFTTYLRVDCNTEPSEDFQAEDLQQIKLEPRDKRPLIVESKTATKLRITNESRWPLIATGEHPVRIAYHWYDSDGAMVEWEGARTALFENIFPGESRELMARITAPKSLLPGEYRIRFGLLELGKRWLERVDDTHTASIDVKYTGREDSF